MQHGHGTGTYAWRLTIIKLKNFMWRSDSCSVFPWTNVSYFLEVIRVSPLINPVKSDELGESSSSHKYLIQYRGLLGPGKYTRHMFEDGAAN
jgi:hypothetical protein